MASWIDRLLGRAPSEASIAPAPPQQQRVSRGGGRRPGARAEYDGATHGRRAADWRRSRKDANAELSPAVQSALRGIAHDLIRNNPFASRSIASIADYGVGTGITFQVQRDGKFDAELTDLARSFFDTTFCDASGVGNLSTIQYQSLRAIASGGAILLRRRWRRMSDRLPVPFQIQALEIDYLDVSKHGPLSSGGTDLYGIRFSPIGRRTGYWLFSDHPGSSTATLRTSTLVPASDVAHGFRADRPGQQNGATWLAPVILRMRDFADYEDAQLNRQKIAAAYAGFVKGSDPAGNIPGVSSEADDPGGSEGGGADLVDEPLDYIEPGTIGYLRDGEEITFGNPPTVDGYREYSSVSLHAQSAGVGIPYEVMTGDVSEVSFISGRLGRLDFKRSVQGWQWNMLIPQLCEPIGQWFLEGAEMMGKDITGAKVVWTPPAFEMLDPASEVPATRDAIRAGLQTRSRALRELGEDPDTFMNEWAEEARRADELGLVFDSDPRKVTSVGNAVQVDRSSRETKGKSQK